MNIYTSGEYINLNPTLHDEDSFFKFSNIIKVINKTSLFEDKKKYKILDIGGGNGKVGKLFCDYLIQNNIDFEFYAADLSLEMLQIQKQNNKYINTTFCGSIELISNFYDIILMIDVIEHIEDYRNFSHELNSKSENIIFNIPIEKNVFDKLRNMYLKDTYYKEQNRTLGHVNFYSFSDCLNYLIKYFDIVNYEFIPYANHILNSDYVEYIDQKKSKIRYIELVISNYLYKIFPYFAKYLVQGSCYSLVKRKF